MVNVKRESKSKQAFWQALVFTIIIFGFGLMMGVFFENSRINVIDKNLVNSEINLIDEQVRSGIIGNDNISCDIVKKSTFDFADRVYNEASLLEEYDAAAKFTSSLKIMHKRYDLLRLMLWDEASRVRKRCGEFHTVIYIYNYDVDDINKKALQNSYSRMLIDLKEKYPDKILLIPIAVNLNLNSINLAVSSYGIGDYPAVVVDENKTMSGLITFDELEKAVFSRQEK